MKELAASAPTIADSKRQKQWGFNVHCGAPCQRVAYVAFEAIGLPDTTIFIEIPRRARLICRACGRRATEISPDWRTYAAFGNGVPPLDGWYVVTRETDGEGRSSRLDSREAALGFARGLVAMGVAVLRIEGPRCDMTAEDVAAAVGSRSFGDWDTVSR